MVLVTAGWSGTRSFALLQRALAPILSVPHAAAAFGLAFLIAPSGWAARLASPRLTGWDRPPDLLVVQDPAGLAMTAGLVTKEVPFLLLMTLAALGQVRQEQRLQTARTLGYDRVTGWLKCVFPAVYRQIRLPVYVVLAYSMSVVDVAMILGPTRPPSLSVQIVKWMGDPDLAMRLVAAAGALLQLALVVGALGVWRLGEIGLARLGRIWIATGQRGGIDPVLRFGGIGLGMLAAAATLLALLGLAVWSAAGFWAFPDALPDGFTMRNWQQHGLGTLEAATETFLVAGAATGLALVLGAGLPGGRAPQRPHAHHAGLWLLYLPLLVPQTAFLPGLQILLLSVGADVGRGPVILAHLVFVLPYVFLSLGDAWRAWDPRNAVVAGTLGAPPWRVFWQVRLPMLLRPILTAVAVGMAVSVGQYLPTLLIGGGRVATLTTEAVALASGGDRRAIGVYGLMQTLAALLPFALATLLPALVWRNRRGLHV